MKRELWIVEYLDEKAPGTGGKWIATEDYVFETRERARKAMSSHKQSCWTKTRLVRYVPENS